MIVNESIVRRIYLLPRAQAISAGDSVFSAEDRQFIAELYSSLLGKSIRQCSCRHKYSDALEEICNLLRLKKMKQKKCNYLLYGGVIIWIGTECYSNHNLTDEVARQYLSMHPEAREKEFQSWPEESEPATDIGDTVQGDDDEPEPDQEPESEPEVKPRRKGK